MPKQKTIKEGDWASWKELDKEFGKLEWLYYSSTAYNKKFELYLKFDGRRKKNWNVKQIKKLKY